MSSENIAAESTPKKVKINVLEAHVSGLTGWKGYNLNIAQSMLHESEGHSFSEIA